MIVRLIDPARVIGGPGVAPLGDGRHDVPEAVGKGLVAAGLAHADPAVPAPEAPAKKGK